MYKDYLYIFDDSYSLDELKKYVAINDDYSSYISEQAYTNACKIFGANIKNIHLNDKYNKTVVKYGKNARINICKPITLFAPYSMTYDPDIFQRYPIGWPIRNTKIQDEGYEAVQQKKPSCITFFQDHFLRSSPYTSHCSAYAAWISQTVFGVSLSPTQIGDWCHAAAEQRDIMANLTDWWLKINSVEAQFSANKGKLVVAVYKLDDPDKEGYKQNGHIAIVLPITSGMVKHLQQFPEYPQHPIVYDTKSFLEFIKINGPEITQSGGLNFLHTVCANGFSNYYPSPGFTPIDDYIEFFQYNHYIQSIE